LHLRKILVIFVCTILMGLTNSCNKPVQSTKPIAEIQAREVELGTIELDLKEFPFLSEGTRKGIFNTIDTVSAQYELPPMLMHLIFRIESGYQFWIEHPQVTINIKGKSTPIRATALGGTVWEIWGDTLRKANIAQTRSDLFLPWVDIRATGLILSIFAEQAAKTGNVETVLPILISKYYGQFDRDYEAKMVKYSSDLFWKRISRELMKMRPRNIQKPTQ
jgi:hypothetical protein